MWSGVAFVINSFIGRLLVQFYSGSAVQNVMDGVVEV